MGNDFSSELKEDSSFTSRRALIDSANAYSQTVGKQNCVFHNKKNIVHLVCAKQYRESRRIEKDNVIGLKVHLDSGLSKDSFIKKECPIFCEAALCAYPAKKKIRDTLLTVPFVIKTVSKYTCTGPLSPLQGSRKQPYT